MYCARLDHFVRFNDNGTIGKCGHMVGAPGFPSWQAMQDSDWLKRVRSDMEQDRWPVECRRCQATEPNHSIRLDSNRRHEILSRYKDYIILGGVLDNICNSACQSCNPNLSTKIGSLHSKKYIEINNQNLFDRMPLHRVVELDINGGEPSVSPNYQRLLENLPSSVRILRINTNGRRMLPNIEPILNSGVHVIVTLSLDGTQQVHDYVRWPVTWGQYQTTVERYQKLSKVHHNLKLQAWTTLHVLNVADFENIKTFARERALQHSWAYLETPAPLNLRYTNKMSLAMKHLDPDFIATGIDNQVDLDEFISRQDRLRNINIGDYF